MTDLSPAAQAVLDAAFPIYDDENLYFVTGEQHAGKIAAATLRAAADQLAYAHGSWAGTSAIIDEDKLLAIAAELEQS
jgi:hypothetical protein